VSGAGFANRCYISRRGSRAELTGIARTLGPGFGWLPSAELGKPALAFRARPYYRYDGDARV